MADCILEGFGPCKGKVNDEHYISRGLQERVSSGWSTAIVGGLKGQPSNQMEHRGIDRLVVRIFCEGHNCSFSSADAEVQRLYDAAVAVDKAPTTLASKTTFSGALIEQGLTKMVVGLMFATGCDASFDDYWRSALGRSEWSSGGGLYILEPIHQPHIHGTGLYFETIQTGTVIGAFNIDLAGLLMQVNTHASPPPNGKLRVGGWGFRTPIGKRSIVFEWPNQTEDSDLILQLDHLGVTTKDKPLLQRSFADPIKVPPRRKLKKRKRK